jgi:hypothetical protein
LSDEALKIDIAVIFVEAVIGYIIWKALDAVVAYFQPAFPLQLHPYPTSIYSVITLIIAAISVLIGFSHLLSRYQTVSVTLVGRLWKAALAISIIIVLLISLFALLAMNGPPRADLAITIVPQYGWSLRPDGTRTALIPLNRSVTFILYVNNTDASELVIWGTTMTVDYSFPTSFFHAMTATSYNSTELPPRKQAVFSWEYGTNLLRDPGNSASLVFTFLGAEQSWKNSETVTVYFGT